jgi:hypothetical protein
MNRPLEQGLSEQITESLLAPGALRLSLERLASDLRPAVAA